MKGNIEILIREDGVQIGSPFAEEEGEFIAHPVTDLASRLARFCAPQNPSGVKIIFYIAEDLLFFKNIILPLQTANIKEAVSYQLDLLTPFDGDMLHSFSSIRGSKGFTIGLYAVLAETVVPHLEEVSNHGFQLIGLFPESQRFITPLCKKKEKWALLLPGRLTKALLFSGANLQDRIICHDEPSLSGIQKLSGTEEIFSHIPQEESPFSGTGALLVEQPLFKEHNLLPSSYRRPDYFRYFLIALCILNVCSILAIGVTKEYKITELMTNLQTEVKKLQPAVKKIEQLNIKEKALTASIESMENIGQNFDIIRFIDKVTQKLPDNCYLDQIRMEKKTGAVHLQGYADELSELTAVLETLDQAKLKSTRRRKNKTYFHVEIPRP